MADHIVAIGFLTRHDLDVLGQGFRRHVPIDTDESFADLIQRLDAVDPVIVECDDPPPTTRG
jgi:hypothetical protein